MSEYDPWLHPDVEELMHELSVKLAWQCRFRAVKRAASFMVAGLACCGDVAMGGALLAAQQASAAEILSSPGE